MAWCIGSVARKKVEEIYDSFTPTAFCQGAIADFLKEKTAMREHQTAYAKEVPTKAKLAICPAFSFLFLMNSVNHDKFERSSRMR